LLLVLSSNIGIKVLLLVLRCYYMHRRRYVVHPYNAVAYIDLGKISALHICKVVHLFKQLHFRSVLLEEYLYGAAGYNRARYFILVEVLKPLADGGKRHLPLSRPPAHDVEEVYRYIP